MKDKLTKLNKLWSTAQQAVEHRAHTLDDTLALAEKFWEKLGNLQHTLQGLEKSLQSQPPPGGEPEAVQEQQNVLDVSVISYLL